MQDVRPGPMFPNDFPHSVLIMIVGSLTVRQ